jgi:hypothetical protein
MVKLCSEGKRKNEVKIGIRGIVRTMEEGVGRGGAGGEYSGVVQTLVFLIEQDDDEIVQF